MKISRATRLHGSDNRQHGRVGLCDLGCVQSAKKLGLGSVDEPLDSLFPRIPGFLLVEH
jgi:hypothetical protein